MAGQLHRKKEKRKSRLLDKRAWALQYFIASRWSKHGQAIIILENKYKSKSKAMHCPFPCVFFGQDQIRGSVCEFLSSLEEEEKQGKKKKEKRRKTLGHCSFEVIFGGFLAFSR